MAIDVTIAGVGAVLGIVGASYFVSAMILCVTASVLLYKSAVPLSTVPDHCSKIPPGLRLVK